MWNNEDNLIKENLGMKIDLEILEWLTITLIEF